MMRATALGILLAVAGCGAGSSSEQGSGGPGTGGSPTGAGASWGAGNTSGGVGGNTGSAGSGGAPLPPDLELDCWYAVRVYGSDEHWQVAVASPIYFAPQPVPAKRPPFVSTVMAVSSTQEASGWMHEEFRLRS